MRIFSACFALLVFFAFSVLPGQRVYPAEIEKVLLSEEETLPEDSIIVQYNTIEEMFEGANLLYNKGRYEEALLLYRKVFQQAADPVLKKKAEDAVARTEPKVAILPAQQKEESAPQPILLIPKSMQQQKTESLYQEAMKYFEEGDYDKASSAFQRMLAIDPSDQRAKLYLEQEIPSAQNNRQIDSLYTEAFAYFNKKNYAKAGSTFQRILSLDPGQTDAAEYLKVKIPLAMKSQTIDSLSSQAISYYLNRDYDRSKELFDEILALDPNNKQARNYLSERIPKELAAAENRRKTDSLYSEAVKYFENKNYDKAASSFNKLLAIDPANEEAKAYIEERIPAELKEQKDRRIDMLYNEAIGYFEKKDYARSQDAFKKILALDPGQSLAKSYIDERIPREKKAASAKGKADSLFAQGVDYFNKKDFDRAEKAFRNMLAIDPQDTRARSYIEEKIPQELALLSKRNKMESIYRQALTYFDNREFEKAKAAFSEILAIDPAHPEAKVYLEERIPKAIDILAKQQDIESLYKQGFTLLDSKKYDEAQAAFKEILAMDPAQKQARVALEEIIPAELESESRRQRVEPLYKQAYALLDKKEFDKARAVFQEILVIDPQEKDARHAVDVVIPKALSDMAAQSKARSLREDALAYFSKKDYERSAIIFREIISLDPGNIEARQYLDEKIPAELEAAVKEREKEVVRKQQALEEDKQKQHAIDSLYKEGFAAIDKKDFDRAQALFNQILTLDSNQKQANLALNEIIPSERKAEADRLAKLKADEEAKLAKLKADEEAKLAKQKQDELAALAKQKQDEALKLKAAQELKTKIDSLYKEGFAAIDKKDFDRAQALFNQILTLDSNQKQANLALNEIIPSERKAEADRLAKLKADEEAKLAKLKADEEAKLAKQKQDELAALAKQKQDEALKLKLAQELKTKIDSLYKEGFAAIDKKDFDRAQALFNQILTLDSNQKQANLALNEIIPSERKAEADRLAKLKADEEAKLAKLKADEEAKLAKQKQDELAALAKQKQDEALKLKLAQELKTKIDSLYKEGFAAIDKKDFDRAQALFNQILTLDSNQKQANLALNEIIPSERKAEADRLAKLKADEEAKLAKLKADEEAKLAKQKQDELAALAKQKQDEALKLKAAQELKTKIDSLYKEGFAAIDKKDFDRAQALFNQILTLDSNQKQANLALNEIIPSERKAEADRLAKLKADEEAKLAKLKADEEAKLAKQKQDELAALAKQKQDEALKLKAAQELKAKIDSLYKEGFAAIDKKDFDRAQALFNQILTLDSNQKQANLALNEIIPSERKAEADRLAKLKAEEEARIAKQKSDEEAKLAKQKQDELAALAKQKQDEALKLKAAQELKTKIDSLYKEGFAAIDKKDFDRAQALFNQILTLDSNQKQANLALNEIIPSERKAEADRLAKLKADEEAKLAKLKADEEAKLAKQKQDELAALAKQKQDEALKLKLAQELKTKIDSLYKEGFAAIDKKDFDRAQALFNQILTLDSNQKQANLALNEIIPSERKAEADRLAKLKAEEEARIAKQKSDEEAKLAKQKQDELAALAKLKSDEEAKLAKQKEEESKIARQKEEELARKREALALQTKIAELTNEAMVDFSKKDYATSAETYKKILLLDPQNAQAKLYIDEKIPAALDAIAKARAAEEELARKREALALQTKIAELTNEAMVDFSKKDYATSAETYKKILLLDPQNAQAKLYIDEKIPAALDAIAKARAAEEELAGMTKQKADEEAMLAKQKQDEALKLKAAQELKTKIDSLYKEGFAAIDKKDFDRAQALFNQILTLDPGQKQARYALDNIIPEERAVLARQQKIEPLYAAAMADFDKKDYDKAAATFSEILKIDPGQELAKAYLNEKIPSQKKAITDSKISALLKDGDSYFKRKDYEKARNAFSEALALDPQNTQAKLYIDEKIPAEIALIEKKAKTDSILAEATGYFNNKEFEKAKEVFGRLIALDPENKEARLYIDQRIPTELRNIERANRISALVKDGASYFDNKDYEKAKAVFAETLKLDPSNSEAVNYLNVKIPKALEAKTKQERIDSLYKEAIAYFADKDYEKSAQSFKQIISIDPANKDAKSYLNEKIPAEKEALARKQQIDSLLDKAAAYFDAKAFDRSAEFFKQVLALDPQNQKAKEYLDVKIPEALALAQKQKISSLQSEATAYFDYKSYKKSKERFTELLALDPQNKEAKLYINEIIPQKMAEEEREEKIAPVSKLAVEYFQDRDFEKSKEQFLQVLAIDPENKQAKHYLDEVIPNEIALIEKQQKISSLTKEAISYFNSKQYDKSAGSFNKVLELDPENEQAKLYTTQTIPQLQKALEREQKISLLSNSAVNYFNNKDIEKASAAFKELLVADPESKLAREYLDTKIPQVQKELARQKEIDALYNEAMGYFAKEDFDKAQEVFNKILAADPAQVKAKAYLNEQIPARKKEMVRKKAMVIHDEGIAYFNNKDFDKAADSFNKALVIDPSLADAKSYIDQKIPQAKKDIAVRQKIELIYQEAMGYYNARDYIKAQAAFKEILALDPKHKEAAEYFNKKIPAELHAIERRSKIDSLFGEAVACFNKKDYEKSAALFKQVLAIDPESKEAKIYLETVIPQQIRKDNAEKLFKEGVACFEQKDYVNASFAFRRALAIDPEHKEARIYLDEKMPENIKDLVKEKIDSIMKEGMGYLSSKDFERAQWKFNQVLEIDPMNEEARLYISEKIPREKDLFYNQNCNIDIMREKAIAFFNEKDFERAEWLYKQILNIEPHNEDARLYLSKKIPEAREAAAKQDKIDAIFGQAIANFEYKEFDKSEENFNRVLILDPNNSMAIQYINVKIPRARQKQRADTLRTMAIAYFDENNFESARSMFQKVLAIDPKDAVSLAYIETKIPAAIARCSKEKQQEIYAGQYAELAGRKPAVEAVKEKPQVKKPEEPRVDEIEYPRSGLVGFFYEKAFNYYQCGELDAAKEYFEKVVMTDPRQQLAKNYLSKIRSK